MLITALLACNKKNIEAKKIFLWRKNVRIILSLYLQPEKENQRSQESKFPSPSTWHKWQMIGHNFFPVLESTEIESKSW